MCVTPSLPVTYHLCKFLLSKYPGLAQAGPLEARASFVVRSPKIWYGGGASQLTLFIVHLYYRLDFRNLRFHRAPDLPSTTPVSRLSLALARPQLAFVSTDTTAASGEVRWHETLTVVSVDTKRLTLIRTPRFTAIGAGLM